MIIIDYSIAIQPDSDWPFEHSIELVKCYMHTFVINKKIYNNRYLFNSIASCKLMMMMITTINNDLMN